mgnify:CR=1 FL=1
MKKGQIINCLVCNKEKYIIPFYLKKGQGKYCSRKCWGVAWGDNLKGVNNPRWNNGTKLHAYGYRLVASPNHPFKDKQGYVREHRLVIEQTIGRYLFPEEDVHHLDGDKLNNNSNNLVICANRSEHIKNYHQDSGKKGWFGYR